ncbi:hypothetical protein, partial [Lactobacillus crispatus]|uniref:hypothetical protein n=1 Tax=Lactobacillus crispatus TaxID=47770 RepID=UPI002119FA7C
WPVNMQPNPILDNNTTWPEGTKFDWLGNDGSTKLTFDKAGESKTGDVTITLPGGSSYTVKDITVISKANVMAKSETVDYGTTLTAADLVTNKDVFPEGILINLWMVQNQPGAKLAHIIMLKSRLLTRILVERQLLLLLLTVQLQLMMHEALRY